MSSISEQPGIDRPDARVKEGSLGEIIGVWLILMLLLAASVIFHFLTHGTLALIAAFGIALLKMGLVMIFYMHLKYRPHIVWLFSGAAFFWLIIFFGLSLSDYATRHWIMIIP